MQKPLVIFDLDGTLSDATHRQWMIRKDRADGLKPDWRTFYRACGRDKPKLATIAVAKALHAASHELWLFSGRSNEVQALTSAWLVEHELAMLFSRYRFRPEGDHQPDDKLKRGWYEEMSEQDRERLLLVFDDRDRMVAMWRSLGVTCFQVAPGDF